MNISNESKIGLMVSMVVALLAVLTVKTGKFNLFKNNYTIKARFQNVHGVNLNSPVMFDGFEVGIVEDITIKKGEADTNIELTLSIHDTARPREGAKAYIRNLGFMGEKYVGLTSGNKGGAYLAPGSVIIGEEPPDFEGILSEGQEIAGRLKSITQNIDERLRVNKEEVDETLTNLNLAMKDLSSIIHNLNERLSVNEKKIDATVTNFHDLSVNLEELSYDLKMNPWKIMYRGKDHKKKGQGKIR